MKIRVSEHAKFRPDKMAKIALAATPRVLLDLYALEPGQAQKVHTHDDQDKIYVVLEGRGRITVGADGMFSVVAKAVQAPEYKTGPALKAPGTPITAAFP